MDAQSVNRAMNNGEGRFQLASLVLKRLPKVQMVRNQNSNDVISGTIYYGDI
jgi:hypothetical protein